MTQQDAFVESLSRLLKEAPTGYGLREYQALYRELIFKFGLRILEAFPLQAGLDWGATGGPGAGPHPKIGGGDGGNPDIGGPGAGPHPGDVRRFLDFPAFVLGLTAKDSGDRASGDPRGG
jgi:hypothetical protein